MKREFLEGLDLGNGAKLPKEAVEAIIAEHGKTVNPLKGQITTLTTDRDTWKTRAETAEAIVEKLPKDVDPSTIGTVLKKAQDDLADAQFGIALDKALAGVKFSSKAAKASIEADIRKQGLKVKDGKILGLKDFVEALRGKDPAAFVDEAEKEQEANKAQFTQRTTTGGKDTKPMTRDEIMAIPDRAARRAAIAENMELFDKK